MGDASDLLFIEARNYTRNPMPARGIDLITLHDMEAPEKGDTAESVAKWFAGPTAPQASTHLCIDNNSAVRGVHDKDIAWHAPGANHNSIGFEHAGYANQSMTEWLDPFGKDMIEISAEQAAKYCLSYKLPVAYRRAADLLRGWDYGRGITTHWQVTLAYHRGNHTDPGNNFPIEYYLNVVMQYISGTTPKEQIMERIPNVRPGRVRPQGGAYLISSDGGVFTVDGAPFFGSMGGKHLNAPVVDMELTESGGGYWLLGADGGIFAFGDARPADVYKPFENEYFANARAAVMLRRDGSDALKFYSDRLEGYGAPLR